MGIKPYHKKFNAIVHMEPPKNLKQLRSFLGMVTYYRDMWPRRSHILSPLTDLLKNHKRFQWNDDCQLAFQHMKALVASDTLLCYPDHNQPFHIETDALDLQLGAVIKQQNKPVAFIRKNSHQPNEITLPSKRNCYVLSKPSANSVLCFLVPRYMSTPITRT